MKKNLNTQAQNANLFGNREFRNLLRFECEYGITVRGGHCLFQYERTGRLVSNVNILSSSEQKELIINLFTSKN